MDLKKLVRLVLPMAIEGVISIRRDSKVRLADSLGDVDFVTRSFKSDENEVVIELQILDEDPLNQILAGEANSFLLASRLSEARAAQSQPGNAAWQVVEHYYAAYYGVHYLLRVTGVSLTNLDNKATRAIERGYSGVATGANIPAGLYTMRYDAASHKVLLTKKLKRGAGGSHHDAWRLWEELVDRMSQSTISDLVEYASAAIDLADHKSFLVKSTANYNPPEIRGKINYQFKGGVWAFERKASESIQRIQRQISLCQPLKQIKSAAPDGLIASNAMIINLAKDVFLRAANNYPRGICRSIVNKHKLYF